MQAEAGGHGGSGGQEGDWQVSWDPRSRIRVKKQSLADAFAVDLGGTGKRSLPVTIVRTVCAQRLCHQFVDATRMIMMILGVAREVDGRIFDPSLPKPPGLVFM